MKYIQQGKNKRDCHNMSDAYTEDPSHPWGQITEMSEEFYRVHDPNEPQSLDVVTARGLIA